MYEISTGQQTRLSVGDDGRLVAAASQVDGGELEPLIVLVPADRCSLISVEIPEMSAGRMSQALRWAAEDAIAGDAAQQHVVPVKRKPDGRLQCLVVAGQDMREWLEQCPRRPVKMVPDAACLPWRDREIVLTRSGADLLARFGAFDFDRFEPDLAESLLPELVESIGNPASVVWIGPDMPAALSSFEPDVRQTTARLVETVSAEAVQSPINLMTGEFASDRQVRPWHRWRLAAMLAGLAVLGAVAVETVEQLMLSRQLSAVEQITERQFARLFPEITVIARPRAQAERALAALKGESRDRFVQMMRQVSPVFSGAGQVRVESLNYADARLDVTLATPKLEDIEALGRQLQAQGLEASVRDVSVESQATRGRLVIREAQ
ncbi:MAG: type II secretion system protein GspL [Wenzhouxiangellaceae bacterium]|nr:type II secretion system protein GspL [Wenzhouxiangellaceae bacterium]